jgi:phospholipid/cholesterol/gamma-HCH transport system ATP-binding protein
MQTPLIQVENLVARYGETVILDKVSFSVYTGEILAVLGGSGCGKSTLLRHMIGLKRPYAGRMLIDGIDISTCDDAVFQQTLKKIGILFQASALFGSMTIGENVALPITEYADLPSHAVQDLVRMKLCQVDLGGYENFMPHELSGGMKKRAGLARALALNPKILFLDEPSAGLDPITAVEIDELLLQINRSSHTTLVIVTHELQSIFKVAQRVIMLDKSTKGIIAQGSPEQLRDHSEHPVVQSFFNRIPRPRQHQGK